MEHQAGVFNKEGPLLLARPEVRRAWTLLQGIDEWVLDRQMELTAIPAPPFGEGPRGERMAMLFAEVGLQDIETDEVGNVLGRIPFPEQAPPAIPPAVPLTNIP